MTTHHLPHHSRVSMLSPLRSIPLSSSFHRDTVDRHGGTTTTSSSVSTTSHGLGGLSRLPSSLHSADLAMHNLGVTSINNANMANVLNYPLVLPSSLVDHSFAAPRPSPSASSLAAAAAVSLAAAAANGTISSSSYSHTHNSHPSPLSNALATAAASAAVSAAFDASSSSSSSSSSHSSHPSDTGRIDVLHRLLDVEKSSVRIVDRVRSGDDLASARFLELSTSSALLADRLQSQSARLTEVEVLTRQGEIALLSTDANSLAALDGVTSLRAQMQSWREDTRRELREEATKAIAIQALAHHQEVVAMLDANTDAHAKMHRAHDMINQGLQAKIHALEARWVARVESIDAHISATGDNLQQLTTRTDQGLTRLETQLAAERRVTEAAFVQVSKQTESSAQTQANEVGKMGAHHDAQIMGMHSQLQSVAQKLQMQTEALLEAQLVPVQQQLLLLSQLQEQQFQSHASVLQGLNDQVQGLKNDLTAQSKRIGDTEQQLEYASNQLYAQCQATDAAQGALAATQLAVQTSILAVSDSLASSLATMREVLPTRLDLSRAEALSREGHERLHEQMQALEAHLAAVMQTVANESRNELKSVAENLTAQVQQVDRGSAETSHALDAHRATSRRMTHSIQLIEEQLAMIQAKVLVASEANPYQVLMAAAAGGAAATAAAAVNSTNGNGTTRYGSPRGSPRNSPYAQNTTKTAIRDAAIASSSNNNSNVTMYSSTPNGAQPIYQTPFMNGNGGGVNNMQLSDAAGLQQSNQLQHQMNLQQQSSALNQQQQQQHHQYHSQQHSQHHQIQSTPAPLTQRFTRGLERSGLATPISHRPGVGGVSNVSFVPSSAGRMSSSSNHSEEDFVGLFMKQ